MNMISVPEQSGHAMPVWASVPSGGRGSGIDKRIRRATANHVPHKTTRRVRRDSHWLVDSGVLTSGRFYSVLMKSRARATALAAHRRGVVGSVPLPVRGPLFVNVSIRGPYGV